MDGLSRVLRASPDAILLVDERGIIRKANQNVEDVLGYTPAELEGTVVEKLLRAPDRETTSTTGSSTSRTRSRGRWAGSSISKPAGRTAGRCPSRSRWGRSSGTASSS